LFFVVVYINKKKNLLSVEIMPRDQRTGVISIQIMQFIELLETKQQQQGGSEREREIKEFISKQNNYTTATTSNICESSSSKLDATFSSRSTSDPATIYFF